MCFVDGWAQAFYLQCPLLLLLLCIPCPCDSTHKHARKCPNCTIRELVCVKTVAIERVIFLKTATPKDEFCALNFMMSHQRHVFSFALVLLWNRTRTFSNPLHGNNEVVEDKILHLNLFQQHLQWYPFALCWRKRWWWSLLLSFSKRYGRIVIYLISCFGVGVTGVVVAFAPNFPVFVIFRFLQGVFGKGTWMTCYVIGKTGLRLSVWEPGVGGWGVTAGLLTSCR